MEEQNQEENNNQNYYAYTNQNMYNEDISYPQQMPMESDEYQQEEQANQKAYVQQQEDEEQMPPIYAKEIESVKETTEHQVKYFEPIEISSEEDVAKYLQSGQLMKQIAPKIQALKQETQQQGMSNDPNVRTQIKYDLKQNDAIYNNQEGEQNNEKGQLNITSPYMNNKLSLVQQGNYDMSKTQQFRQEGQMQNNNLAYNQQMQEGPGGIKYSSVLPPKFAQTKVVTIDQYGNRHEEDQNEEVDEDPVDNDEIQENAQQNNMQQRHELEEQQFQNQQLLKQQQMQQQQLLQQQLLQQQQLQQQQLLKQQQFQQQRLEQQRLEQQRLEQQRLEQQRIEQQRLEQQRLEQQKLEQQKLEKIKIQQQQIEQQRIKQQQLLQQQRLQEQQRIQQQSINAHYRPSNPKQNTNYPYSRAYSDNKLNNYQPVNPMATKRIAIHQQPFQIHPLESKSPNKNIYRNNINIPRKDPIVQKVYKISGTLRRRNIPQNINNIQNNTNLIKTTPIIQKIQNNNNNIQTIQNNTYLIKAAQTIQNFWRSYYIKKRFEQIKPQLLKDSELFLSQQYELCDKAGPVASDDDFTLDAWKKFYPANDPFFNFDKGFVIAYGIKIKHPNDPEKVQVYEGDININNERHGFGRLTTVKSVFLGEWRNDKFTGWGRETRRSGKILEGKYIDGVVEGKGILKNNKGNTYVGDFSKSKRHGKGILDTHKVHYEGEFKNDKLSGKGRIIFKNEGHVYEGEFDNNEINGYGTFKWKNGDSYTGQMMNGKMHGNGVYRYNNGKVFEGTYANGIKQGMGKYYNISQNQRSMVSKNNDPKGFNISGMTTNTTKFGGGK